jgi:uncharacterized membrane protein YkvA (DUF1232 family)
MSTEDYSPQYSEESFWEKVKKYGKLAGIVVLERAFTLYYALIDVDTPDWAKVVIIGALGYFIVPLDAIPDIAIPLGYTDDAAVLAGALFTIHAHIKDEHKDKGRDQAEKIFD